MKVRVEVETDADEIVETTSAINVEAGAKLVVKNKQIIGVLSSRSPIPVLNNLSQVVNKQNPGKNAIYQNGLFPGQPIRPSCDAIWSALEEKPDTTYNIQRRFGTKSKDDQSWVRGRMILLRAHGRIKALSNNRRPKYAVVKSHQKQEITVSQAT